MNKKYVKMILPAVIIFTAGAAIKAFPDLSINIYTGGK